MKAIKYVGQILAALIYTPLYTGIMYLLIVLSTGWIITLPTLAMIAAMIFLGGIIEGLIALLQVFGLMPYVYIVKKNVVSFIISIGLCIIFPLMNLVNLWRTTFIDYGKLGYVFGIIVTGLLLHFIIVFVIGICSIYEEGKKDNHE